MPDLTESSPPVVSGTRCLEQNDSWLALGEEGQEASASDSVAFGDLTGVVRDGDLEGRSLLGRR